MLRCVCVGASATLLAVAGEWRGRVRFPHLRFARHGISSSSFAFVFQVCGQRAISKTGPNSSELLHEKKK